MSFVEAIRSGFSNYVNFSGRALRSEYWYWTLFTVIVSFVAAIVDAFATAGLLGGLIGLALLLPGLAVSVRRLHDIDKSAWNLLWGLIPLLGFLYLLYLYTRPGTPGPNSYGPPPQG